MPNVFGILNDQGLKSLHDLLDNGRQPLSTCHSFLFGLLFSRIDDWASLKSILEVETGVHLLSSTERRSCLGIRYVYSPIMIRMDAMVGSPEMGSELKMSSFSSGLARKKSNHRRLFNAFLSFQLAESDIQIRPS